MGERCMKCGGERTGKHPWCSGCRRDYRKGGKAAGNGAGNEAVIGNPVVITEAVTRVAKTCPNCQVLADDVKRLKRDLAAAHEELETLKGGGADRPEGSPRRDSTSGRVVRMAARPDNDKQYTAHGARCMCQWCQQQRRVAALEGA